METQEKIKSISLHEIISHARGIDPDVDQHTHQGCLVARISGDHVQSTNIFKDPIRVNAIVFILCTQGSLEFSCNLQDFKVEAGSLLLLPPKSMIVKQSHSKSLEGYTVILDTDYLSECNFNSSRFTALMVQIVEQFQIQLTDTEQQRLIQSFSLLDQLITEQIESPFREDIIRSMVETGMYLICELFSMHSLPKSNSKLSRQESYFRQFITELNEHYTERQNVTYYAEKLCISSRYLTTIVRRISGLTVTEWMNKYLLMEAKYLLKYSEMSIQEIAYRLAFPDQSFFGKYFKQHIGMSPSQYRNQQ